MATKLSEHFSLEELTHTDHRQFDNTPNADELANLTRLAKFLEDVRVVLGDKPIMINSAFRSKQVNDAVGSKDTSQHRIGRMFLESQESLAMSDCWRLVNSWAATGRKAS